MADVYKIVYREFKRAGGGGADGSIVGVNGSVSARCVEVILQWMEVGDGKTVFDFGCGPGMFLVCCRMAGARGIGVELPDNKGHKYLFDAACKRIGRLFEVQLDDVEWRGEDIDQVLES